MCEIALANRGHPRRVCDISLANRGLTPATLLFFLHVYPHARCTISLIEDSPRLRCCPRFDFDALVRVLGFR